MTVSPAPVSPAPGSPQPAPPAEPARPRSWLEFWNGDTPIYVSARHKALHYRGLARDTLALLRETGVPRDGAVLDHGCGEALFADEVARACGRLLLCDGAPAVRAGLAQRFTTERRIRVVSPEEVEALADASLDLVVANSLLQYLKPDELTGLLHVWQAKLKPGGTLALADVIPPGLSPVADAGALLRFAWKGGFLAAAVAGLARTAVSDYRRLRGELGLATYEAADLEARLVTAGFDAPRRRANLGHNPARMTFLARKPSA